MPCLACDWNPWLKHNQKPWSGHERSRSLTGAKEGDEKEDSTGTILACISGDIMEGGRTEQQEPLAADDRQNWS